MVNVLIVDDSFFVRRILSAEVEKIPDLTVVATARNGLEALKVIEKEQVDIITLDLEMPEMDGLRTLKKMNKMGVEIPVIVISSLTQKNSETAAHVLELGAVDVLPKPTEKGSGTGIKKIRKDFREKLIALAENAPEPDEVSEGILKKRESSLKNKLKTVSPELLIIGGSTGAPPILHSIVEYLPSDFSLPVVIIQHMEELFLEGLATNLGKRAKLPVNLVTSARKLKGGNVYIPGKNKHLLFRSSKDGVYIRLKDGKPVSGAKPSVDVSFQSAASVFREKVIAVLLTGMGQDGADGMEKLHQAGALCLGQDRESSVVYGMPGVAAAHGALDLQASAKEIPRIITDWAGKTARNS